MCIRDRYWPAPRDVPPSLARSRGPGRSTRGRHGRLLAVVATSPSLLGLGIDEDTAAEIGDEQTLTVLGSGAVFVVDARGAVTGIPAERPGAPLLVYGAVVHSLPPGPVFDLAQSGLCRPADPELATGA